MTKRGFVLVLLLVGVYAAVGGCSGGDPKGGTKEKAEAALVKCVENRLDPRIAGDEVLPNTWAGIRQARANCMAVVNELVRSRQ